MLSPLSSTTTIDAAVSPIQELSPAPVADTSSFDAILNQYLEIDKNNQVNEEQLFTALIGERIGNSKGSEIEREYNTLLSAQEQYYPDGSLAAEDTARAALQGLVDSGSLTTEEAEKIHAQAFKAAQLDNNTTALYDSRGSRFDNTIAVMLVESAIESAKVQIDKFDAGEDAGRLALEKPADTGDSNSISTNGTTENYPAGFVFKPVSESNGNLAILLPSSMAGSAQEINLIDEDGNIIERGDSYGIYEDGRPLFRFGNPGSGYPHNLTVQVILNSGSEKNYSIPDPSQRYD